MTLEPEDLARLYETQAAGVLWFFARRTLQADVAIDLVAGRFARAFANRGQFRGSSESEAIAWVFGIAHHEHREALRLRVVEEQSYPDIARTLGVSEPDRTSAREPGAARPVQRDNQP
jgi:DNA-directed RNA polymerase specialized sigma24 family protein